MYQSRYPDKPAKPEMVTVLEERDDGRSRMAVATRSRVSTNGTHDIPKWSVKLHHPSGEVHNGQFWGTRSEVTEAMSNLLRSREEDFRQDGLRGDVPAYRPTFAGNGIPLADAPVVNIPSGGKLYGEE